MQKLFQGLKAWLEVFDTNFAVLHLVIMLLLGASFSHKGEVNHLKRVRKKVMAINGFSELGEKEIVNKK